MRERRVKSVVSTAEWFKVIPFETATAAADWGFDWSAVGERYAVHAYI